MSSVTEILFTTIPLIAFVANIFLLFTLMSAKKDSSIYSFMGLLGAFILWSGGAYLMRMQFLPGVVFWWKVSLTGIFLVPYMYYLLVSSFFERKGHFLKSIWGILTLFMVIANIFDFFMTTPVITVTNTSLSSEFSLRATSIIAVVIAAAIFVSIIQTVRSSVMDGTAARSYSVPLMIGVIILIVGIVLNSLPGMHSFPTDTLACAINAGFIYYAFYKKRFYAMSQITSKGSVFIISIIVTVAIMYQIYTHCKTMLEQALSATRIDPSILLILICSIFAIILFLILNKLHEGLFIRDKVRREDIVRGFAQTVNASLNIEEILKQLSNVIKEEVVASHLFICLYDEERRSYIADSRLRNLEQNIVLSEMHPIAVYMRKKGKGFFYNDFIKSPFAKSLHEGEKQLLLKIRPSYITPLLANEEICGMLILSEKENKKEYSFSDITYVEAASSVAAVSLKNAMLYQKLEEEALIDGLTGLLNRRAFTRKTEDMMQEKGFQASLILFNMDDFGLYNELYGNTEGDILLQKFAGILTLVFGKSALIARYGGNEYAVLLPFTDVYRAEQLTKQVKSKLEEYINGENERMKKFLTFSAGICAYPALAGNVNQLLTYANLTVFQIKQHGKNGISVYSAEKGNKDNTKDNVQELLPTIYALTAAIDAKDHYTFNHSRCVSEYASLLASYAGLGDEMVEVIRQAGLLHDIGKIGIPDAILTKSSRLTDEEYAIMKQHVERSIEMIRHLPALDYVIPAVLGHHERFDGRGYPRGIAGEAIPISARCLAVADSFDAMISKRAYKNKMPLEDSLAEIERNLGTQFDPELGRLFIELIKSGKIQVIPY